ncbi:MAG: Glyoxalase/bleomycin resistance protein/dioxygenase [Thermoleophilia bacterium]|nr:Glyoxalase/bleomycin resistance protein/dioxygenase [Thermoleophilia bacterium]
MSVPQHPNRSLFVNIPVEDLDASVAFFTELGFSFNPLFTDETATCMLVGEQAYFMLLTKPRFQEFTKGRPFADLSTQVPAMYCFSVDSREAVDTVAEQAVAAGGTDIGDPQDMGFMRSRAFADLDGHYWEVLWMDPAAAQPAPDAELAEAN